MGSTTCHLRRSAAGKPAGNPAGGLVGVGETQWLKYQTQLPCLGTHHRVADGLSLAGAAIQHLDRHRAAPPRAAIHLQRGMSCRLRQAALTQQICLLRLQVSISSQRHAWCAASRLPASPPTRPLTDPPTKLSACLPKAARAQRLCQLKVAPKRHADALPPPQLMLQRLDHRVGADCAAAADLEQPAAAPHARQRRGQRAPRWRVGVRRVARLGPAPRRGRPAAGRRRVRRSAERCGSSCCNHGAAGGRQDGAGRCELKLQRVLAAGRGACCCLPRCCRARSVKSGAAGAAGPRRLPAEEA